MEVISI